MRIKFLYIYILLLVLAVTVKSQTHSSWPDNLDKLKAGICLVEYFQPQFEMGEIKDKSRIKRKK